MNRSKLKEALRPLVKEALSDYLKDSEEDMRALQAAHPQLDLKSDLPSETGSGDNATRGVRTEVASAFDKNVVKVLEALATKRSISGMKTAWLQDALKVCKSSNVAEPGWGVSISKELQKRGLKEGLEGDLQSVGAMGTKIQKVGGKTIVHLSNPKLAQKVADRLNDSGEYEVEVMKDGGIMVKYQSPVTQFDETSKTTIPIEQVQRRYNQLSKQYPPHMVFDKLADEFKIKRIAVKKNKVVGFEPVKESTEREPQKKNYYTQDNVGKARYVVNFHDGKKTHEDGSAFYDIRTFSNKVQRDAFVKDLKSKGYKERVQEASTSAGVPGYQTPYAFSDVGIGKDVKKRKIAQQLGYKLVKKEGLKEEMRVNIMKAVPLNEGFRPQLQTPEAKALHDKIDYYMMIASDPHYRQIHKFRVAISKLKNPNDQKQMIQYFNDEFKINWGSAAQSAWEYYKKVD